jgi:hypothetical protein
LVIMTEYNVPAFRNVIFKEFQVPGHDYLLLKKICRSPTPFYNLFSIKRP